MFVPRAWANGDIFDAAAVIELEQRISQAFAGLATSSFATAGTIESASADADAQIRLAATLSGQAWLRFGTDGTDPTDSTGFYRQAAGWLRTNTFTQFDAGLEASVINFSGPSDALLSTSGTAGANVQVSGGLDVTGAAGFNGAGPQAKPTVTGSRAGNAALASLLSALAAYGLITDSSSA